MSPAVQSWYQRQLIRADKFFGKLSVRIAMITTIGAALFGAVNTTIKVEKWYSQQKENTIKLDRTEKLQHQIFSLTVKNSKLLESVAVELAFQKVTQTKIIENYGGCYYRADKTGRTVELSSKVLAITGRTEDELLNFNWQNWIPEPPKTYVIASVDKAIEQDIDFHGSFPFYHGNGSLISLRTDAYRVPRNGGLRLGYVCFLYKL